MKKTKEVQQNAEEKLKVLENKMKNAEAEREKDLKNAQQKLDGAKKKADASCKKMKEKEQVKILMTNTTSLGGKKELKSEACFI